MKTKLKDLIYKKGFNMYSIAEKAGIAREGLYMYFNEPKRKLRKDTMQLIAESLNVPYERIEKIVESETR